MNSNIIYTLITLFPIIDVITALQTRSGVSITLGIVLKGLLVLYLAYYIVFKSTSKYKKFSMIFLVLCGLFVIGYFGFKPELLQRAYIITEITMLFKILFMPIVFLGLLNYFEEHEFDKHKFVKAMKLVLIEYTLLLLVPYFTGTAYKTYFNSLLGFDGWFYSGNEVSIILVMILPFLYYFIDSKKKYNAVIALPVLYAYSLIGTKVSFLGTLIIVSLYFIFSLFKEKFKINTKTVSTFIIMVVAFVFFILINPITIANTEKMAIKRNFIEQKTEIVKTDSDVVETEESDDLEESSEESSEEDKKEETVVHYNKLLTFVLSTRDVYFERYVKMYNDTFTYDYIITGMGFSNTPRINNHNITKYVEIDFIDLYFHTGIAGLLISLMPTIAGGIIILKGLFSKSKKIYLNLVFGSTLGLIVCVTCIAGHLYFYPSAALYLVLYLIYIYGFNDKFKKERLDYNKVQILALHLKSGGIETVLTNQANMLAKKYDVEIVSLYNTHEEIPYDLNSKIKVTYLTNTISNRDIIKELLNKKDFIKLIPEVSKAIKILYLKPRVLKKFIINSNAGTIISTRCEFGKILGSNHRKDVVTITEEHVYHKNNKKLIESTINNCKHVDYLLPTSKELVDFYTPIVKADVRYIKNVIKYYPKEINKLNNKKLIAIGRLSEEKGFIDLIPIMKDVIKKDKNITLDIYGEGPEKENILNAIKKNKLDKNITIKGFVSYNKLNELRKDYSLMVIPSYEESFGLAALESMAFGIPCIIYDDAKGLLEFINNDNGIIISKRNHKKFANSIIELISNKKELLRLGINARNMSENYYFNKVQEEFIDFMEEAINNANRKHRKVMFISSTGGHFNEMSQLKSMFKMYNYHIITEKTPINSNLKKKYNGKLDYVLYGTRFHPVPYFLFILPVNCFISLYYYIKYRPEFIISTGAHTAGPMCCIGKIFGSKIIFIETFANSLTKTATGKIVYKFADLFIVQWESMLELYPNATFGGWIF